MPGPSRPIAWATEVEPWMDPEGLSYVFKLFRNVLEQSRDLSLRRLCKCGLLQRFGRPYLDG